LPGGCKFNKSTKTYFQPDKAKPVVRQGRKAAGPREGGDSRVASKKYEVSKMKKFLAICVTIGFLLAVSTAAQAISYTVITPNDLADGPTFANGQGGVPFGYDPDMPPPIGSFQPGPIGFGNSSFWSDVQGSAAGGGRDYTAFRMSPKDIFGVSDVTISDLFEISYYTKWESDLDWQLKIYTEGDATHWYRYRFNFTRPMPSDHNWHNYVTDTDLIVSDVYDKYVPGYVTVPGTGLLSDLDTLYGTEKILFIDIISSYATNSPPGYTRCSSFYSCGIHSNFCSVFQTWSRF